MEKSHCRVALYSSLMDDLHCVLGTKDLHWVTNPNVEPDCYPVGADVRSVAAAQLVRSIFKKFEDEVDLEATAVPALDLFRGFNTGCRDWRVKTDLLGPYDEVILGEFRNTLWQFFTVEGFPLLSMGEILPYLDFGPGSAPGLGDRLSFCDKVGHVNLTSSKQSLVDEYYQWVEDDDLRVDCEIARLLRFGPPEIIQATSLTPVPKTEKIARLVKTEPSLNMFFQKGIQAVLERRLRSFFGIDLSTQPEVNSRLAREGSIHGTYATIDLKSASDSISMKFCEKYLPREAFAFLKRYRSEYAIVDGQMTELHMMATMGNAFCFPLQTVIFACLVSAVYRALGLNFRKCHKETHLSSGTLSTVRVLANWGVFGDDIIVETEAFPVMLRLLSALGFVPNRNKSFGEPFHPFRESCGSDYWAGIDVRGVYVRSLKTPQDWCSLFNRLTLWSAKHSISLPSLFEFLLPILSRSPRVPPWDSEDAGVRVPSSRIDKSKIRRSKSGSILFRRYAVNIRTFNVSRESQKPWRYWNSSAILLAAIKGTLRGGRVTLRQRCPVYHTDWSVAPCWDYFPVEFGYEPKSAMRWSCLIEGLLD